MAAAAPPVYCTDLIVYPSTGVAGTDDLSAPNFTEDVKPQTFVGLSNQGATCYMNSLLQTLYMTPEFRHTLYKWTYSPEKDGDEQYCIPLQLQKLFGRLQLSSSRAVDTVALTKSFGWEGNERFQQQDVQELCRVLFDALEESFKGHPVVENFIDELYAGELVDYIKCMDVDYQSERKDKFLDYSIAIRPFGAEESMKSVTECIEHYLEPEILDGDNQYFADSVGRKVDAIKGLKFGSLPQVMAVQMKRFVFDFSGESIVQKKINDKVTFPLILDMNKYVSRGPVPPSAGGGGAEPQVDEFDQFLKKRIKELRSGNQPTSNGDIDEKEEVRVGSYSPPLPALVDCNGSALPAGGEGSDSDSDSPGASPNPDTGMEEYFDHSVDPLQLIADRGEWVYQLYAVLVHSGAISGGHYYVYIRDISTDKWWNFNDSSVTEVSEKTVLEAQGGFTASSSYLPAPSTYVRYPAPVSRPPVESCANAYMLMYRKVTAENMVVEFPSDDLVPAYIRDEVKRISEEAERRKKETRERMNKITVAVHWKKKKYDIATKKTTRYKEFLQQVWSELPILADEPDLFDYLQDKESVPLEGIRLRVFNTHLKMPGLPYDVEASGDKTLDFLKIALNRELFIEVKGREDVWESYVSDGITVLMCEFDSATSEFKADHKAIRLPKTATLGEISISSHITD
jgi:ubiquitin carboxyl-terminal hydrolase 47